MTGQYGCGGWQKNKREEGSCCFAYSALFMIGHGIGHLTGFLSAWTRADSGFKDRPWIFSPGVTIRTLVGKVFGLIWLLALLGFVASGLGLIFGQAWWPTLAIISALISLLAIVPWWRSASPGAWAGDAFDLVVLVVLLSR